MSMAGTAHHYCHVIGAPWLVNGGHGASLRSAPAGAPRRTRAPPTAAMMLRRRRRRRRRLSGGHRRRGDAGRRPRRARRVLSGKGRGEMLGYPSAPRLRVRHGSLRKLSRLEPKWLVCVTRLLVPFRTTQTLKKGGDKMNTATQKSNRRCIASCSSPLSRFCSRTHRHPPWPPGWPPWSRHNGRASRPHSPLFPDPFGLAMTS